MTRQHAEPSHHPAEHLFTLTGGRWHAEANFDAAVRGYHRGQVDRYLAILEAEQADLIRRVRDAEQRLADAHAQLARLRAELASRPLDPATAPPAAWLGHQLEQILTLAEQEADRIRADARRERDALRRHADATRAALASIAAQLDELLTDNDPAPARPSPRSAA